MGLRRPENRPPGEQQEQDEPQNMKDQRSREKDYFNKVNQKSKNVPTQPGGRAIGIPGIGECSA